MGVNKIVSSYLWDLYSNIQNCTLTQTGGFKWGLKGYGPFFSW